MFKWRRLPGFNVDGDLVVREREVYVPGLPAALAGMRIAHVSDLHFRSWDTSTEQAHEALERAEFDLLAATGDFCWSCRRPERSVAITRRFFSSLRAPLGQFAVMGNHDPNNWPQLVSPGPLEFLRNRCAVVSSRGASINVVGLDCAEYRRRERPAVAMAGRREGAFTLVLCHYPSSVRLLTDWQVDLVLAGHTHGGQVRLPVLGCVWAHDSISTRHALGLHRVAGALLHVTGGIGTTGPVLARINCPPEISVLELHAMEHAQ